MPSTRASATAQRSPAKRKAQESPVNHPEVESSKRPARKPFQDYVSKTRAASLGEKGPAQETDGDVSADKPFQQYAPKARAASLQETEPVGKSDADISVRKPFQDYASKAHAAKLDGIEPVETASADDVEPSSNSLAVEEARDVGTQKPVETKKTCSTKESVDEAIDASTHSDTAVDEEKADNHPSVDSARQSNSSIQNAVVTTSHHTHFTRRSKKEFLEDPNDSSTIEQAALILNSIPLVTKLDPLQLPATMSSSMAHASNPIDGSLGSPSRGRRTKQLPRPHRSYVPIAPDVARAFASTQQHAYAPDASQRPQDASSQGPIRTTGLKSFPLEPMVSTKYQGDMEQAAAARVPEFLSLINFPAHLCQPILDRLSDKNLRCCVMCGRARPFTTGNKGVKTKQSTAGQGFETEEPAHLPIIPTQNKGVCTVCDVKIWVVTDSGLQIRWCKGCKNFRPWAAFGEKGLATKCLPCRERQKMRYAQQKDAIRDKRRQQYMQSTDGPVADDDEAQPGRAQWRP